MLLIVVPAPDEVSLITSDVLLWYQLLLVDRLLHSCHWMSKYRLLLQG